LPKAGLFTYDCDYIMNKFWKNLNCLASDHPLPPALVSIFKNALGEDSTSLKYLTFVLSPNGPGGQIDRDILEENFNMVDTARKYHLSLPEVQKAIQMFVERRAIPVREGAPTKEVGGLNGRNGNGHESARRLPPPLGPYPVCGATISRLDSRRSDGGEVVEVGEGYAMVYWAKAAKKTKVSIARLRDVRLFKVKSPAGADEGNAAKAKRNGHSASKGKRNGLISKVRARSTGKSVVRLGAKKRR